MKRFYTGLIVNEVPAGRCRGAGWEAIVEPCDPDLYRQSLVLLSRTHRNAQRALELIWECLWINLGGAIDFNDYPEVAPEGGDDPTDAWLRRSHYSRMTAERWSFETSGILEACVIAARASRHRNTAYAAHLLAFSQSLAAIHHMDLDPSHWRHQPAVSPFGRDHVRLAYALIASYTAIEQLGLELRASAQRPSKIEGEWNPPVKSDLEARLRDANVDLSELALWTRRGTIRRVEMRRPPRRAATPEWSAGPIRDVEVEVVDAIADVSWLRSKVSAHRLSDDAASLTIYEVSNAQYLARRLLLSRLGLWRVGE
jgi:hypothetical protein